MRRWMAVVVLVIVAVAITASLHRPSVAIGAGIGRGLPLEVIAAPGVPASESSSPPPFTGTSEISYMLAGLAPKSAARVIGRYQVDSTWSVADAGHFRLDIHTLQPALQSHFETLVANGTSLIWYKSIFDRAWIMPLASGVTLGTLGMFQGGSLVAAIQGMGSGYFAYFKQHGGHARLLRQEQVLGRTADVFEIWPLYTGNSAGYGRALVWLDQEYPLVLRLQMKGLSKDREQPHNWLYRVTSLTFGQGPTPEELAYQPGVTPTQPPSSSSSSSSGAAGPNTEWQVPKGFVAAGTPAGYTLSGSGQDQDPMWGRASSIQGLFVKGTWYVYVQEQVRVGGLPAAFTTGPMWAAGNCRVWTGRFSDSPLHWLALIHGKVSMLVLSNHKSEASLVRYAARKVCLL